MQTSAIRRYSIFLYSELFVVLAVMGIFRMITDRLVAGALAGSLFLISTLAILIWEWRVVRRWTLALLGGLLFFFGGVVPIVILRLLSWGEDFDKAQLFGVPGGFWHRASNLLFLFFLVGIFVSLQQARRAVEKPEAQR